jgi:3-oxoacyl-[acyl-carrier-protein] synthase II
VPSSSSTRLVITGAGLTSSLGDLEATWQALLAGRGGVGASSRLSIADRPCGTAAECDRVDPGPWLATPKHAKFVGRSAASLLAAGRAALAAAAWPTVPATASCRVGVYVASGDTGLEAEDFFPALGAAWEGADALDYAPLGGRAARLVDPYFALRTLANAGAAYLASLAGASGPSTNLVQGEVAGAAALREAAADLLEGRADVAIVGAHDSLLTTSSYLAYERQGLLARGGAAARPRPFDARRDGTVLGEAAAVLILEREEGARRRGAALRARLAGAGIAGEAGEASLEAWRTGVVEAAVAAAGGTAVDLVLAQALGTRAGDQTLASALAATLGPDVPVTSLAGAIGHVGAATAIVQAVLATRCLGARVAPPVVGLDRLDPACGVAVLRAVSPLPATGPVSVLCLSRSWSGQAAAVTMGTVPDVDFEPANGT